MPSAADERKLQLCTVSDKAQSEYSLFMLSLEYSQIVLSNPNTETSVRENAPDSLSCFAGD